MKLRGSFIIAGFLSFLLFGWLPVVKSAENLLSDFNFKKIAPDVYLFKDVCNVYVLKSGSSARIIDSGSGIVTDHLKALGIEKIDWVFHTHYHRDQCNGSSKLKR